MISISQSCPYTCLHWGVYKPVVKQSGCCTTRGQNFEPIGTGIPVLSLTGYLTLTKIFNIFVLHFHSPFECFNELILVKCELHKCLARISYKMWFFSSPCLLISPAVSLFPVSLSYEDADEGRFADWSRKVDSYVRIFFHSRNISNKPSCKSQKAYFSTLRTTWEKIFLLNFTLFLAGDNIQMLIVSLR